MKKLVLVVVITALTITGCKNQEGERAHSIPDMINQQIPQDYSPHNTMNSVDYFGYYTAEISPADGIYAMELVPEGFCQMETVTDMLIQCMYRWDVTGSIINIIDYRNNPLATFYVGEGFIKQIDTASDEQVLKKQN